ncbi:hypothetical protein EJB05_32704, partial [Eragrostis curvula]
MFSMIILKHHRCQNSALPKSCGNSFFMIKFKVNIFNREFSCVSGVYQNWQKNAPPPPPPPANHVVKMHSHPPPPPPNATLR